VAGMLELRALARHVSDAAFGQFRRQLKYKATWYGTEVVVADRWFPSSKTCSGCGTINPTCRCRAGSTTAAPAPLVIDRDGERRSEPRPLHRTTTENPPLPAAA
jgi:putative transposase